MANWKNHLDISDMWDQANEDESKVKYLCTTLADRLDTLATESTTLTDFDKDELREYADEFRVIAADAGFESFNLVWNNLYDWADFDHRLFIKHW